MPSPSFTRLLDWIALDPRLSDIAVRGYWILRAHVHESDDDPLVRVTDAGLAGMLNRSEKTAKRCRRQLEEVGLIVLVERTTRTVRDPGTGQWVPRTTNVYRVVEEPPRGYAGALSPWDWRRRIRNGPESFSVSGRTDLSAGRTDTGRGADTDDPLTTKPFQRTPVNESAPSEPGAETRDRAPAREAAERTEPLESVGKDTAAAGAAGDAPPAPPAPVVTEPPGWAIGLLSLIPDAALARPAADRCALALRLAALADAGVERRELAAAVAGADTAARPYPALSARLASPQAVRAWNTRSLGAGTEVPPPRLRGARAGGLAAPAGFGEVERDPADTIPGFAVDSEGRAAGTCPAHPSIRNIPGEVCAVCGGMCRSFPEQDISSTAAVPSAGQ
ncbi:MAG TPA: hypothetical protein VKZ89_16495, partial [Thermobifida alba]|nr:hypothetical protein [Thermobifida alba]